MATKKQSESSSSRSRVKLEFGWREWIELPDFGITGVKAKIDTGARTSALHALNLHSIRRNGKPWARFDVQPLQKKNSATVRCEAPVIDHREVRNSGGQVEHRVVIETTIAIGGEAWPIEVTLTNRSDMRFRMLLGRTALRGRGLVNPSRSFVSSKAPAGV